LTSSGSPELLSGWRLESQSLLGSRGSKRKRGLFLAESSSSAGRANINRPGPWVSSLGRDIFLGKTLMNRTLRLGSLFRLKFMARMSAVTGFLLLWLIFSLIGWFALDWGVATAVLTAFFAAILHFLGEFWHQLGHAWAAHRTGWPMSGVMFIWVLAASLYPRDEPELPARTHIRRALGGPAASLLLAIVMGMGVWGIRPFTTPIDYLLLYIFLDNLLFFTLGAMLPLGFTDGSTLLRYWPER
jgi:hypothetical protein